MTDTDLGHRELERLIFFSDAVFAIVMTLLILEIRAHDNVPPDVAATEVPNLVWALWPKFFSYVLSFLVIGTYWIAHHQTFRYVRSYNRTLLWLNLVFLLSISFIPFPTDLLGEYGELRFSVIVYAASLGMARLLLAVVWWYIVAGPIRTGDELDPGLARYHFFRSLAIPALFFLSIGISLVSVNAAVASWLLLFVADVMMWRLQRRRVRSST
jgi:TMEM175 potassium channel family protein